MGDQARPPEVRIFVVGAFRVLASDGEDITPRGRKARALLAILALTPTRRRSRPALQDKLWSDRGSEQGAASLRQTLTEIRRAFGERFRDCLVSDMRGIGLAQDRVTVDVDTTDLSQLTRAVELPQLLEDIDVSDEEFEDWLRQQRTAFEERLTALKASANPPTSSRDPRVLPRPGGSVARPWLRLLQPLAVTNESGIFLSRLVADRVAQGLVDQWGIDIRDDGKDPQGAQLRVEALPISRDVTINVVLLTVDGATQLWSGSATISLEQSFVADAPRLQALINQSIEIAGYYLRRVASSSDASSAFASAFDAVQRMFRIDLDEVDRADALLASAYELDPKAVYLAWRAYARSIYVGELYDRRLAIEEAEELVRRALEADPHNATVLALASHVYGFVFRKYALAHEMAELSVKYNPAHPMGHAYLGRAKSYLGDYEAGYRETCRALELSGQAPYRHVLHTEYGMTSLASGRFDEALRAAEIVRKMAPKFRPPQRYLVPLYLRLGARDKARDVLEKLRQIEPTFSLEAMRATTYPNTLIRASGLLRFSDRDL
jgi:DNA-binding SARP family transcriptional activator